MKQDSGPSAIEILACIIGIIVIYRWIIGVPATYHHLPSWVNPETFRWVW